MVLTTFSAAPGTDRVLRETEAKIMAAFWEPRPYSAEQEARAHLSLAKSALLQGMALRRHDMRCFPGIYSRDRAVSLRASVARLELASKRRRHAANLLKQARTAQIAQREAA